jgi:hypothetical protein
MSPFEDVAKDVGGGMPDRMNQSVHLIHMILKLISLVFEEVDRALGHYELGSNTFNDVQQVLVASSNS